MDDQPRVYRWGQEWEERGAVQASEAEAQLRVEALAR